MGNHIRDTEEGGLMEAVRWAQRTLHREMRLDYSKWHATKDHAFTLCGHVIPLALEGTYLPETDALQRTSCGNCLRVAPPNREEE